MFKSVTLIIFLVLSGCSSNPAKYTSTEQVDALLKGQNKDFIVSKFGAPNESLKIERNIDSWTYKSFATGFTGGTCNMTITFVNEKVKTVIINAHDRSWVAYPLGSCENLFKNL